MADQNTKRGRGGANTSGLENDDLAGGLIHSSINEERNDADTRESGSRAHACRDKASVTQGVRGSLINSSEHQHSHNRVPPLAHRSTPLVAQLNSRLRVVDDPLQWIVQVKKDNPCSKSTGWEGRSYCRTRTGLLRCVSELGEIDPRALAKLESLPDWHPDWVRVNLDTIRNRRTKADGAKKAIATKASAER